MTWVFINSGPVHEMQGGHESMPLPWWETCVARIRISMPSGTWHPREARTVKMNASSCMERIQRTPR
ncbi:hypothetical protein GF325_15195 [Candidatus Bathyarchaeota archaeon]|nr:hypothetical protein [Candidatus Bathyarchaeota archaeon]